MGGKNHGLSRKTPVILDDQGLPLPRNANTILAESILRVLAIALVLAASAAAQTTVPVPVPSVVLDNEVVRVTRLTVPAKGKLSFEVKSDAVVVRFQDETARFIPKGNRFDEANATDREAVDLLVELKRHWEADMRLCSYPMKCTRETRLGEQPIAWTTSLFTNGFVTATTHKVVMGGTLTSSYYTAKGADSIILIPFTGLNVNFGGIEENLKAGQPYFRAGTEVEVTGKDAESRWFVLRVNTPGK